MDHHLDMNNGMSAANRWEIAELEAETAAVQHSLTARRHPQAAELLERHAALFAADAGLFGVKASRARATRAA